MKASFEEVDRFYSDKIKQTCYFPLTVFRRIISAETSLFWIWPYVLWPLVTVHKGVEIIQGRKLFKGRRYSRKSSSPFLNRISPGYLWVFLQSNFVKSTRWTCEICGQDKGICRKTCYVFLHNMNVKKSTFQIDQDVHYWIWDQHFIPPKEGSKK